VKVAPIPPLVDDRSADAGHQGVAAMIPIAPDARVWLVTGHTDMRKGYARWVPFTA
jgi:hypothetical protein